MPNPGAQPATGRSSGFRYRVATCLNRQSRVCSSGRSATSRRYPPSAATSLPQRARSEGRTRMSTIFEEHPVGVRAKISALWIAMLFLFAYGDIFGFFVPGHLEEIIRG